MSTGEPAQKLADQALYNPVQPIYLAAPRFVGGALDPMPERVLVLPGDERSVALPEPTAIAIACAPNLSLGLTQSPLLNGFDLSENDDLIAGLFNLVEFKDAVEHLTCKGRFDKGEHDHMLRLAFICADVTVKDAADADAVRELYFWVVEKTGRDQADNEARYDDALRRTQGLNGGGKIVTPGTIFHWAHELGWTGLAAAQPPPAFTPPQAIELAIIKARATDAYKMGRLKSRDQARVLLARILLDHRQS